MNPTGTTYLQPNNSYVWADGDCYEIVQTDQVEGAASGASFSGIGVDNQPHQVLLNKLQYLHNHQVADENTLNVLQKAVQGLTCSLGPSGWLKIGSSDQSFGEITIIMQWGTVNLLPYGQSNAASNPLPPSIGFAFPIAYTKAVWLLYPYWQSNESAEMLNAQRQTNDQPSLAAVTPFGLTVNTIGYALNSAQIAGTHASGGSNVQVPGMTGIGWVSLGY